MDTNVVLYLHSRKISRLSQRAMRQIEDTDLLVPAMVMLELQMLYEKGVIRYSASQILSDLNQQIGVTACQLPMAVIVSSALGIGWTREPADRLITANAMANNDAPLITSDRCIQEHYPNAIW